MVHMPHITVVFFHLFIIYFFNFKAITHDAFKTWPNLKSFQLSFKYYKANIALYVYVTVWRFFKFENILFIISD